MSNTIKQKIKDLDSARTPYNTLRGLTIQRAVSMLEEGELGVYTRLAWTARKIERRWSVMIGLKKNREGALLNMDWDIRTVPEDRLPKGFTQADAERQAGALRAAYEKIQNIREAIKFLHLASFRGFSHLEKINAAGRATMRADDIVKLEPIFQWHMIRDGMNGPWRFDELLTGSFKSATSVDLKTMIVREVEDPICEIALIAYVYEMLGRKDWAGFVEVFGIPDIFFVMPQNTGKDDSAVWDAFIEEAIGAGKGKLPFGSDIKTAGGDVRGSSPFSDFVKFQREDVVLAGTGGKLTMMAESGSGTLAGNAQSEVFERIAAGEAREISEIFQQAIDLPLLADRFAGQPVLAWFEIAAEKPEDTKEVVRNIAWLAQAGYVTEPDQVQEKTGLRVVYSQPAPGSVAMEKEPISNRSVLKPWTWFGNRRAIPNRQTDQDTLLQNARKAMAKAIAEDLRPVADRIAEILDATPDGDLFAALKSFQTDELPDLARKALAGNASADALEQTMVAALFNGLEDE
jgi:phage gp29-like protein